MTFKALFASQTNLWSANEGLIFKIASDYTYDSIGFVTDVPIYFAQCAVPTGAFTPSYSTAGTTTFTVPANVNSITITGVGAGGGGGGGSSGKIIPNPNPDTNVAIGGGGGGAGGYRTVTVSVTPGDVLQFVISAGGTGGAAAYPTGGNGTAGGTTTVTNLTTATVLLTAPGGSFGLGGSVTSANYQGTGGAGGVGVTGTGGAGGTSEIIAINKFGIGGGTGTWWRAATVGGGANGGGAPNSASSAVGGGGGGSFGGFGGTGDTGEGDAGTFGAGGAGGGAILGVSLNASAGGNGGDGAVYLSYSTSSAYTPEGIIFLHNKTNGWTIANGSTTLDAIPQQPTVGAGFPAGPLASGAVYLDGFIFVMDQSGRIYNSGIEDPTTWNALDFISAGSDPDYGVAIAKQLNYVVAFNTYTTQFFYDAGNAVGSPLGANISANLSIGCAHGDSVAAFENTIIWIGQSRTYGKAVYILDGLTPNRISTRNVEKVLEFDPLTTVYTTAFKWRGHTLYLLTLPDSDVTLVYDLEQKIWTTWSSRIGSLEDPTDQYFIGAYFADYKNIPLIGSLTDNNLSQLVVAGMDNYISPPDEDIPDQSIICSGRTEIYDSGTTKRKFYRRLEVIGDKPTSQQRINISHYKDDYTVQSAARAVNLFNPNGRPQLVVLGADRRRAWEWETVPEVPSVPIRLESFEVDFDLGGIDLQIPPQQGG